MIWKSIPGFSEYEISENGDVRKSLLAKRGQGWRHKPGAWLKPSFTKKDKYLIIHLISDEGRSRVCKIHQLVALTFWGSRPTPALCALHKDDHKQNNHYSNLYWGTKKQNAIDRSINGKGRSKLTAHDVCWIRELYHHDAWLYREIGELYGMDTSSIAQIIKRKTFTWVAETPVPWFGTDAG